MGLIQSQEQRGQLTKIERRMVQAMAERAQKANVTLKTFNTFILKFPKIDTSFEAVREVFNKAGLQIVSITHSFVSPDFCEDVLVLLDKLQFYCFS